MDKQLFWDEYLGCYDALNRFDDYQAYLQELTDVIGACSGKHILDAGSGTGNLSIILKKTGAEVLSLDFSATGLREHKIKDPDANQLQASLEEKLPLASKSFDGIVCASVLFSLSPDGIKTALSEFHRLLKPGGRLVLTAGRPEISKVRMAWEHYRSILRSHGVTGLLSEIKSGILPTLKILYYNYRMYSDNQKKSLCQKFSREELIALADREGFSLLRYGTTMGGRFHLLLVSPRDCPEKAKA